MEVKELLGPLVFAEKLRSSRHRIISNSLLRENALNVYYYYLVKITVFLSFYP